MSVTLNDSRPLPASEIKKVVCDDFIVPPRGHSKDSEFDLLCHLELEPVKEEKKGAAADDVADGAPEESKALEVKYKSIAPGITDHWLQMTPSANDYIKSVVFCF